MPYFVSDKLSLLEIVLSLLRPLHYTRSTYKNVDSVRQTTPRAEKYLFKQNHFFTFTHKKTKIFGKSTGRSKPFGVEATETDHLNNMPHTVFCPKM